MSELASSIEVRGSLNVLEYNTHVEMFFRDMLNILFRYQFINLNTYRTKRQGNRFA